MILPPKTSRLPYNIPPQILIESQSFMKENSLTIALLGNPILSQSSLPVSDPFSESVQDLIKKMKLILDRSGGIGLAAPQVHHLVRIFMYFIPKATSNPKYALTPEYDPDGVPLRVLINPTIVPLSTDTLTAWEGCLSVPGLLGEVQRPKSVKVSALNEKGQQVSFTAQGFHARALQHENDHLEGVVFPSRLTHPSRFGYTAEIQAQRLQESLS